MELMLEGRTRKYLPTEGIDDWLEEAVLLMTVQLLSRVLTLEIC